LSFPDNVVTDSYYPSTEADPCVQRAYSSTGGKSSGRWRVGEDLRPCEQPWHETLATTTNAFERPHLLPPSPPPNPDSSTMAPADKKADAAPAEARECLLAPLVSLLSSPAARSPSRLPSTESLRLEAEVVHYRWGDL
jgi:hypothetical protein